MTGRRVVGFAVLSLLTAAILFYWWSLGRPVDVPDAHVARIACVSYAPYRRPGESPFEANATVTPARIEEDLSALARRFDCVRTYSVGQGLDQVPAIARRHHMKVLLGIWLSRNVVDNDKEIDLALATAKSNQDVIRAVVVGNEVLLRGELSPTALAADIARVRQSIDLPVTYADVWEYWIKYPQIAPVVSFITIHILPYWEDDPVPVSQAVAHVEEIRRRMQAAFPGREVLIGETGWPSAGRQREGARPSLVNEARFMRGFLNWAQANNVSYNVIEAFDQPWKRLLEGTAGGYWGVYDANLHEKFAQQGAVVEERHASLGFAAAALGGLLLLFIELASRKRWVAGAIAALLAGAAIGAVGAAQVRELVLAERNPSEWAAGLALSVLALISALLLARLVIGWLGSRQPPAAALSIARLSWRAPRRLLGAAGQLGALRLIWLFGAAVMNLLLCFDARYRDFPIFLYAVPSVGLSLLAFGAQPASVSLGIEEKMLAVLVALSAMAILWLERPSNGPALVWVLICLLLSSGCIVPWARGSILAPRQ